MLHNHPLPRLPLLSCAKRDGCTPSCTASDTCTCWLLLLRHTPHSGAHASRSLNARSLGLDTLLPGQSLESGEGEGTNLGVPVQVSVGPPPINLLDLGRRQRRG